MDGMPFARDFQAIGNRVVDAEPLFQAVGEESEAAGHEQQLHAMRLARGEQLFRPGSELQALLIDPRERFFIESATGRPHFDLPAYVVHRLIAAGVEQVEALHLDTYSHPDRFYSYRRSTHRGEADYGRQVSLIALP